MPNNQYQAGLFQNKTHVIDLHGLCAEYRPEFIQRSRADSLFRTLLDSTDWQQDTITVYGKKHLTPRLSSWVGEPWMSYRYSNHTMQAVPWSPLLRDLKAEVETACAETFNSVFLNYYRNGQDSNGWHSDNEPELGEQPLIASLSLGGSRDFQLRNKHDRTLKQSIKLAHGSLLLMGRGVQESWQHQVPKRAHADPRINLTFRTIVRASSI